MDVRTDSHSDYSADTRAVLFPIARHCIRCLVLVQPRKTRPDINTIVDWGVKNRNETKKQNNGPILFR